MNVTAVEVAIRTEGLTKAYGSLRALDNVDHRPPANRMQWRSFLALGIGAAVVVAGTGLLLACRGART
jgi:hypothetical protein